MLDGVRILAVHHDGGLNGATLLFQTVLEGLTRDYGADVSTRVLRDGPVVERARALGPVHVEPPPPERWTLRRRLARRLRREIRARRRPAYDIVFANSVASLGAVEQLFPRGGVPLAVYVHESQYLLEEAGLTTATRVLQRADLVFAVSAQVRANIESLIGPSVTSTVVSGFVPVHPQGPPAGETMPEARAPGRIVGAIGTMSWYKGTDLFLVVARRVRELLPDEDVRFVWVGEPFASDTCRQLTHDLVRAELDGCVGFPGRMDDPTELLRSLSVLLLPSREDSWPLVMMEAAAEGVPMVCFRGSGGAEQFIDSGGGTAVPYLDVEAMARAVVRYLSDPELRERDSRIAREHVRARTGADAVGKIASELAALHASRSTR